MEKPEAFDVIVVGAGAAGIGVGVVLKVQSPTATASRKRKNGIVASLAASSLAGINTICVILLGSARHCEL